MGCLDSNQLALFLAGELEADEREAVEAHIDACPSCRLLVAEIGRSPGHLGESTRLLDAATVDAANDIHRVPALGDVIAGRFVITRELGRGGMGVVFEAKDQDLDAFVALKFLAPKIASMPGVVDRLKQEVKLARRISHPGVCRIFDVGRDGMRWFMSMELLTGTPLSARLQAGTLSVAQSVSVLTGVLEALAAIHAEGIVHRDLKPGNIMLREDESIVVADFGLAGEVATQLDSVVGTPAYWAPEQGSGGGATAASDVYAAGRIAQDLLGPGAESLPMLRPFIAHCLQPFAQDRFPTAREALAALRSALAIAPEPLSEEPSKSSVLVDTDLPTQSRERRVLVAVFASGVRNMSALAGKLQKDGASIVTRSGSELIAVFGHVRWEGDEPLRAVRSALNRRDEARVFCVSLGAFDMHSSTFALAVQDAFARAKTLDCIGVAATQGIADAVAARYVSQPLSDGLTEIVAERALAPDESSVIHPLVGYAFELSQLQLVMDRVRQTDGAYFVELAGAPGIGKSRLCNEFRTQLRGQSGLSVFYAEAEPLQQARGFSLLASLLASRAASSSRKLRFDPSASKVERRQAIVDVVASVLRPDRAREVGAAFAAMFSLDAHHDDESTAPHIKADRIRAAWGEYLEGVAAHGPVAFVVENLQWVDFASIDLLASVLESLQGRIFVLLASRPGAATDERRERLRLSTPAMTLHLRGLSASESETFVQTVMRVPLSEAVKQSIVKRSEGNPFVIEQLVRTCEQIEAREPSALDAIPVRIEATLQWRLDHLQPELREACRAASVVGSLVDVSLLTALGVSDAATRCRELVDKGLLRRADHHADLGDRYVFASRLTADVAYRSVIDEQRVELHRVTAEQLSARGAPFDVVARHRELAGQNELAARDYANASMEAMRRGDSLGVLDASARALSLGTTYDAFALRLARAEALRFLGRREEQRIELLAAFDAATTDQQRSLTMRQEAFRLCRSSQLKEATEAAARAVQLARAVGDDETLVLALCSLTYALGFHGEFEACAAAFAELSSIPLTEKSPWVAAQIADAHAIYATLRGDVAEASVAYEQARVAFVASGRPREAASALVYSADTFNRLGRYAEAVNALEAARKECQRLGNRLGELYALVNLAYANVRLGAFAEAMVVLDDFERLNAPLLDARVGLYGEMYRALCFVLSEHWRQARSVIDPLIERAIAANQRSLEIRARALLARVMMHDGQSASALDQVETLLSQMDVLGSIDEDQSEVVLMCVDILRAVGRSEEAAARLANERKRLVEMASRIADDDARHSLLTAVVAHARVLATP